MVAERREKSSQGYFEFGQKFFQRGVCRLIKGNVQVNVGSLIPRWMLRRPESLTESYGAAMGRDRQMSGTSRGARST